jgi:lipopolysaccharide/colanic/teichoic acid biosynthesis glycosyltransferase
MNLYRHGGKRLFDLALVLLTAPFWGVLLLLTALAVRLKLGTPVLFRQKRPGLNGRIFEIIKFRTMTDARDAQGNLFPDPQRLTAFGRWLRATSLDELPEFFNVLRGDMSLVGPRPLLIKYLPLYSPEQARRHEAMPGITGLPQVKGRNMISWEDKFRLDVWYVDNLSWWLDINILFLTVWKVLRREGVVEPASGMHQEFTGTPVTATQSRSIPPPSHPGGNNRSDT